jgi:hypothetical protein
MLAHALGLLRTLPRGVLVRRPSLSSATLEEPDDRPLLDEALLSELEQLGAPTSDAGGGADAVTSAALGASTIAQLRAIQRRDVASPPGRIVVIGPETTTLLHQQMIELLSYALVLSGNRVLTTGSTEADRAVIRGAIRANDRMVTVVVPNTVAALSADGVQQQLRAVRTLIELQHTNLPPEIEQRLVYAELLGGADRLIAFTFHRSYALVQAIEEAQAINVEACVLYLD